ncbi:MAG: glycosyltransferase family 4 protein [Gammaproteobacteria bacterium]|nr:glycosyltransferase family 4 protein [Gammaproteobacteria bacterium]
MNLLLLNYEFPPLGGGASSATFHMARELARRGHHVDVLTSRADGTPAEEIIDGAHIYRVASWRRGVHDAGLIGAATYLLSAAPRLWKLTRASRYDCAHFFFSLPTGALAPCWRRWTKQPYVISMRGSDVPAYDSGKFLAATHRLLRARTSRILSDASQVVANSASLCQLAKESFPEIPLQVITNGVCTATFHPRTDLSVHEPLRLLAVARLVRRKGLEVLINAMAHEECPRCRLEIVGDGRLRPRLQKLVGSLRLDDRVEFTGRLHGEELARRYRSADCFVLPSLAESFSMSLLEAMASGLPVVASRIGGIPELVEDRVNGRLVSPGSVEALVSALNWISSSSDRRRQIGHSNREKICADYSWSRIVDEYEKRCYEPAIRNESSSAMSEERGGRRRCE